MTTRFLFADQLGPHFTDDAADDLLFVESKGVFRRTRFHRQKAHLVLSALHHRVAQLGERATLVRAETYREALADRTLEVIAPTSYGARRLIASLPVVRTMPSRGFVTSEEQFSHWAQSRGPKRLVMEEFYRDARRRTGVLMDGDRPVGGAWNFDKENRLPPPKSGALLITAPFAPNEDEIDERVRATLDRWERSGEVSFVGADRPRWFAVTREEALRALETFIEHRLAQFGPYEDAMSSSTTTVAHSLLSVPINLGLLHPLECIEAAAQAYERGAVPLSSAEGFIRQLLGWRDYVWHLYWHLGPDYRANNALGAHRPLPDWLEDLKSTTLEANCLRHVVDELFERGWVHHIPRLMVLGNWAMQRGTDPGSLAKWMQRVFVDGYDWVMIPNVIGMSQHADGGIMATKPYAAGGAYIKKMSNYCTTCPYDPRVRVGETACPFTAGYWRFLHRHKERFSKNPRMAQAVKGLSRLADLEALLLQAHVDSDEME